jgi:hypothetical protein
MCHLRQRAKNIHTCVLLFLFTVLVRICIWALGVWRNNGRKIWRLAFLGKRQGAQGSETRISFSFKFHSSKGKGKGRAWACYMPALL